MKEIRSERRMRKASDNRDRVEVRGLNRRAGAGRGLA